MELSTETVNFSVFELVRQNVRLKLQGVQKVPLPL